MANGTLSNGLQLRGQIWHMRFKLKGILVTESTHTSNKREAERILAKRKSDMVQDMVLDSKRPSNLHYAIDQFVTTRNTAGAKRNALYSLQHFKDGIGDKH